MLGMTAPRGTSVARVRRRAATALASVIGAALLVLGVAAPALAHDGLVGTGPADGATVTGAPAAVELEFTGEPLPLGTLVTVTGPDGVEMSSGDADISGTTVTQALAPEAPPGAYRVEWRSTSSDGHALSGSYDFTVTATGEAAATGAGTAPATADAASTTTTPDQGIAPVWLAAGAVVLVGLGALVVTRLRRRG